METIGPSNLPPWDPYVATCPTRQVLDCVANKWAVLVLGLLSERRHRFGELQRGIDGVSQKVLSQTLKKLERDGLIARAAQATDSLLGPNLRPAEYPTGGAEPGFRR